MEAAGMTFGRPDIGEQARLAAAEPWDVIIIGAGIAGGTAACVAADAGLRVLLVEKFAFPRPNVCGGCLSLRGVRMLERAGLSSVVERLPRLDTLSLRWGDRHADTTFAMHRVVARPAFDLALLHAAAARGVTVLQPLSAVVVGDGLVRLAPGCIAKAKAVMACDGLGGTSLTELAAFGWNIHPRSRMGLGATLEAGASTLEAGRLVMRCASPGYLGAVRLGDGTLDVAAAIDHRVLREGGEPGETMAALFADTDLSQETLRAARWRGTPLLTRRRRRLASGRTLVVGDAAGYVEPFTGEGMTWAIEGAIEATSLAVRMVRDRCDASAWAGVHEGLMATRRRACSLVAGVLRSRAATRSMVSVAARFPNLAERGARLVAGVRA
jgi:flavin-dependent dehydrogenase